MATKPIKFLELHYTMTQFLIIFGYSPVLAGAYSVTLILKPGFHMIVRIVPVVSKKMFRRPGRSYGNATQTIANDPDD